MKKRWPSYSKMPSDGYDFELYVATLLSDLGYEVSVTPKSNDYGADVIAIDNLGKRIAVQVKFYNSASLGNGPVQEVLASLAHWDASEGWVVTNSSFSENAKTLAKENNIRLIDGDELNKLIRKVEEGAVEMATGQCPHCCGTETQVKDGFVFCSYCGAKLRADKPSVSSSSAKEEQTIDASPLKSQVTEAPKQKAPIWLWVIGWIFCFPIPLTILMLSSEKAKDLGLKFRIVILVIAWLFYLGVAFGGASGSEDVENSGAPASSNTSVATESQPQNSQPAQQPVEAKKLAAGEVLSLDGTDIALGKAEVYIHRSGTYNLDRSAYVRVPVEIKTSTSWSGSPEDFGIKGSRYSTLPNEMSGKVQLSSGMSYSGYLYFEWSTVEMGSPGAPKKTPQPTVSYANATWTVYEVPEGVVEVDADSILTQFPGTRVRITAKYDGYYGSQGKKTLIELKASRPDPKSLSQQICVRATDEMLSKFENAKLSSGEQYVIEGKLVAMVMHDTVGAESGTYDQPFLDSAVVL